MPITADEARRMMAREPRTVFGVAEQHHLDNAVQRAALARDYVRIAVPGAWDTDADSRGIWLTQAAAYLEGNGFTVVIEDDSPISSAPDADEVKRCTGARLLVSW